MLKRFRIVLVFSLLALKGWLTAGHAEAADQTQPTQSAAIYDPDPNHLWNRLFVAFYRQNVSNNLFIPKDIGQSQNRVESRWVGPDVLDPPLGKHPSFLLEDEPFSKANAVLDEFLSRQGASQIHDPLKRAMLQHDLWAVFDVLAQAAPPGEFHLKWIALPQQQRHRNLLKMKLAQAIRSLALSRSEIESLPDTYSAAINSGAFSGCFGVQPV